ncbi:hypothetical protein AB0M39_16985 [Streptomyces sp. NPDC051907]|uniref:hypothetical protein n=1 Tax=Streptomyces sp. NPDC051907 TaxID=3155284 RepID=UPI003428035A
MSFDAEWASARSNVTSTRLNQVPAEGGGGGSGGTADYKVTSQELKSVGNEAQDLYHGFEGTAFHAGAETDTASTSLTTDGFETGSALWAAWDKWRTQSETLLSACAHIHNHLEDTSLSHADHEEVLVTNFSMSKISEHFS